MNTVRGARLGLQRAWLCSSLFSSAWIGGGGGADVDWTAVAVTLRHFGRMGNWVRFYQPKPRRRHGRALRIFGEEVASFWVRPVGSTAGELSFGVELAKEQRLGTVSVSIGVLAAGAAASPLDVLPSPSANCCHLTAEIK
jgi:hypothetical protein